MPTDLLARALDAHGGLDVWRRFSRVEATIVSGGLIFEMKGQPQDPTPRRMTAALQHEWASVQPFGADNQKTDFTPERIAIETLDGAVVAELMSPEASFKGDDLHTPWNPLQRAYFNGYALWTYLTSPFLLALPGFTVRELDPIEDDGRTLTGLQVTFPAGFVSHSTHQEFYFGPDLLLARHDYRVETAGSFSAIQYISDYVKADGVMMPTKRRAYRCGDDGRPLFDQLMVSIDLSDYHFS
ncbi:MAG: hypothetical protein K2X52_28300 [Mycobacteriaceae bacterium]|nr:hypothetical protein [Mycobacteriaceae bacterium]